MCPSQSFLLTLVTRDPHLHRSDDRGVLDDDDDDDDEDLKGSALASGSDRFIETISWIVNCFTQKRQRKRESKTKKERVDG